MGYYQDGKVDQEFAKMMVWLAEATGAKLTEGRIRSYAMDLHDVPWEPLRQACARARRECTFFPSIPDIRRQLGASPDDSALLAWAALGRAVVEAGSYVSVEVEDGCAAEALLATFGSWPAFCAYDEGPGLALKRQEFLAAYRSARRSAQTGPKRLAGSCEASGQAPSAQLTGRVWSARITAGGVVEEQRDAVALPPHGPQSQIGDGKEEGS